MTGHRYLTAASCLATRTTGFFYRSVAMALATATKDTVFSLPHIRARLLAPAWVRKEKRTPEEEEANDKTVEEILSNEWHEWKKKGAV